MTRTMTRTTTSSRTLPSDLPLVWSSSKIISPSSKSPATVAVSPAQAENMGVVSEERSLRHMRTVRQFDYAHDDPPSAPPPYSPISGVSGSLASAPRPTRDAPVTPQRSSTPDAAATRLERSLGGATASRGSLGAAATASISRLRRQKTLMPEDFKSVEKGTVSLPSDDIRRPESAPPQRDVNLTKPIAPGIQRLPRQGFARIFLDLPNEEVEAKFFASQTLFTGIRHYTVWDSEISRDTVNIHGVITLSAFPENHTPRSGDIYHVTDVSLHVQTFSQNNGPYAKDSEEAPAYFDFSDLSGKRRRTESKIDLWMGPGDIVSASRSSSRHPNAHNAGHTRETVCQFTVGIPLALFKSVRERYFRVSARVGFDIGSRHPLSFANETGLFTHVPTKAAEAVSGPVDFSVSYLALPKSDSGSLSPGSDRDGGRTLAAA